MVAGATVLTMIYYGVILTILIMDMLTISVAEFGSLLLLTTWNVLSRTFNLPYFNYRRICLSPKIWRYISVAALVSNFCLMGMAGICTVCTQLKTFFTLG